MTAFAHLSILPRGKTKSHEQRHDGQHTCASDARRCGVGTKLTAWPPPPPELGSQARIARPNRTPTNEPL